MKEQLPPELRDYIDVDDIEIYSSDLTGELRNESAQTPRARVDENGLVGTSTVPELSIMHKNDADQLSVARGNIGNILGTVTGRQVSYAMGSIGPNGGHAGMTNKGGAAGAHRTALPQTGDVPSVHLASMALFGLAALAAAFGLKRRRSE